MTTRLIETERDQDEGIAWLIQQEPRFAEALAITGPLGLRKNQAGFAGLLSVIIGQQVSVASANAIWRRMLAAGLTGGENIASATDDDLRACGLSRQKILYAKSLAASGLDFPHLATLPDAEVIAILTEIKGIGRWTAEVFTMLSMGRADVFAPGDLALQEAARVLFDLSSRPNEQDLRHRAANWSPWQSVAARILWAYYRAIGKTEGIR